MKIHEVVDMRGDKHSFSVNCFVRADDYEGGEVKVTLTRGEPFWVDDDEWTQCADDMFRRAQSAQALYEREIQAKEKANALLECQLKREAKGRP